MTSITRIRLLVTCCALVVLAALPASGLASNPSTATKPQKIVPAGNGIFIAGKIHLVSVVSPMVLLDEGNAQGTPFGTGTTTQYYTLHPKTGIAETDIEIDTASGSVTIKAVSHYETNNVTISFSGVARITGGTGAYEGLTSGVLEFQALHSITGKKEAYMLTGSTAHTGSSSNGSLSAALAATKRGMNVKGTATNTGNPSPLVFTDSGTLSGRPFGSATVESADTFDPNGKSAETTFTITGADGTVSGVVLSGMSKDGATLSFQGLGMVTSATGAHRGLTFALVRYTATYRGPLGTIAYRTVGQGRNRDRTINALKAHADKIGAALPSALRN